MASNKSATALRTIGEVAEELDVATHVLRFWESKFHQIKPQKRRGRRYYRPEDVAVITKIKELLYEQGYTIRGVQKFLIAESKKKTSNEENNSSDESNAESVTLEASSSVKKPEPTALQPNIFAPQHSPVASFKTDMFGNIIPANVGGFAAAKASEPAAKASYSNEDIAKLKQIYSGLLDARERLKKIA